MLTQQLKIGTIPAILWGEKSGKLFIAVYGDQSNKADSVISVFMEEAVAAKYQGISFDLPGHGERKNEGLICNVQDCVQDLNAVLQFAQSLSDNISIFACSSGAYFSLLSYRNKQIKQSIFLSPVVDMLGIINNMMSALNIDENKLKQEKIIPTPFGQTLYWDYYSYVKSNLINGWNIPSSILCGSKDNISGLDTVSAFAKNNNCNLRIMENGEHYFHTEAQLSFFRQWIKGLL